MTGTFNPHDSWEMQPAFDLENGFQAVLGYNTNYGEMISRINYPDRKQYWHCSNGLADLPEFARPWVEVVVKSSDLRLVRPGFEKVW
ncbi:MAG: hypothetical protein EKK57_07225 [Proteobacteria bacterium]|nr:MAG: hypothetical protein EKK57_07225 [Pseudomonadota bacterium]